MPSSIDLLLPTVIQLARDAYFKDGARVSDELALGTLIARHVGGDVRRIAAVAAAAFEDARDVAAFRTSNGHAAKAPADLVDPLPPGGPLHNDLPD